MFDLRCFLSYLSAAALVAACGGDGASSGSPTDADLPGSDTSSSEPDAASEVPDSATEEDAAPEDTSAEDTSDDGPDGEAPPKLPQAWVYPISPASSAAPELVSLRHLQGDGTLTGQFARVRQCSQDLDAGASFIFSAANFQSPATLCAPAEANLANAEGSFVDVPSDGPTDDLADGYAAVATYYALQQAHAFFSETHGWSTLDEQRVEAVVNVQAHLGSCGEWEGIPEGFYLPSGFLPKYGGLPIADGPVIALGQAADVDLAHFLPVTVHEYAHVIMGNRLAKGQLMEWGTSLDALALGEGLSDYFSSAITGATVHADFGLGPGEMVVFAPCGIPLGGVYSYDTRRDLTQTLSCPESLAGHTHGDGLIASSALWAARSLVGEAFDAVAVEATRDLQGFASFEELAEKVIDAAQLLLEAEDAAAIEALLSERGLVACERTATPAQIGARGFAMTLSPWLGARDALGPAQPGPLQLQLDVPAGSTEIELTIDTWTPFTAPSVDLILKKGAPVTYQTQPKTGLVHDGQLVVPVHFGPNGKGVARATAPCLEPGIWYASIWTREPDLRVLGVESKLSSEPVDAPSPTHCAPPTLAGPVATGCAPADIETIQPAPGEEGHRAAARIVPPTPFIVESVAYQLSSIASCDSALPHRVELSVTTTDSPGATPTVLRSFDVAADASMPGWRTRRVVLDQPLLVKDGESLVVSVEMTQGGTKTLCVAHCTTSDTPQSAFWSNATDPPYAWDELSKYGLSGDLMITALGHTLE